MEVGGHRDSRAANIPEVEFAGTDQAEVDPAGILLEGLVDIPDHNLLEREAVHHMVAVGWDMEAVETRVALEACQMKEAPVRSPDPAGSLLEEDRFGSLHN